MAAEEKAVRRLNVTARHLASSSGASPLVHHDTCGIVAYTGNDPAVQYLLEGLHILENRGYDSAGITTLDRAASGGAGALITTKYASAGTTSDSLPRLESEAKTTHKGHTSGIAHTRWATHGGKTDANAHPHLDAKNRVAIVHNGVIQNYAELREELKARGIVFKSETDSEVIAQLIGRYMDEGDNVVEAARKTHGKLQGTWGVVVIAKDLPGKIIAMKNGSPLLVGMAADGSKFVASEPGAFARHTRQFIALQDMEFAVLGIGEQMDLSRVQVHSETNVALSPEPWPHWTIKEIMEQPVALSLALNYGGRILDDVHVKLGGLESKKAELSSIRHLVIAACGTSMFSGMYGAALMRYLGCLETSQVIDAAELNMDNFPKHNAGLLLISQSGETKDVHRAALLAAEMGVPAFSIVNVVGSLIARTTGCGLYLNAGREVAVASTKAFTSQVCCLALISLWFAQQRSTNEIGAGLKEKQRELVAALHRLPTSVGMALSVRPQCHAIAERLVSRKVTSMFVLGKGLGESVAREGALKIKEITYVHAEGYGGGALKHGPFALIDKGTPIILILLDDSQATFMDIAAHEVRARGAYTIVITNNAKLVKHADEVVEVPSNGPLSALIAIVPIQLIAYEMSVLRGINPDKPRNLAKAVTVD